MKNFAISPPEGRVVRVIDRFVLAGKVTIVCEGGQVMVDRAPASELLAIVSAMKRTAEGESMAASGAQLNSKQNEGRRGAGLISLGQSSSSSSGSSQNQLQSAMAKRALQERAARNGAFDWGVAVQSKKAEKRALAEDEAEEEGRGPRGASKRRPSAATAIVSVEEEGPRLTSEQRSAVRDVLSGASIFLTGPAGTGKSLTLMSIISALPAATTACTAATGIAATSFKGASASSLHAWAGIGRGEGCTVDEAVADAERRAGPRWRATKTLVIDEVSMVSGELFTLLEAVARRVRNNPAPFGGLQLVLCGDFLQLPPVAGKGRQATFAFESEAWARCGLRMNHLERVHRQADPVFTRLLNHVRRGECPPEVESLLRSRLGAAGENDDPDAEDAPFTRPIRLMTHRGDVDENNAIELGRLPGAAITFHARDSGPEGHPSFASMAVGATISLKVGAPVILLKNLAIANGLSNGLRGVVTRFQDGLPVVTFPGLPKPIIISNETWTAGPCTRTQLPLGLAFAISIHRAQGLSLPEAEIAIGEKVFENGMAYVALSRVRSLEGLKLLEFDPLAIRANHRALHFHDQVHQESKARKESVLV
jgi:ATP-dependent DNA helicase PIF1